MVQPNATRGASARRALTAGAGEVWVSIVRSVLSYLVIASPNQVLSPEGGELGL